MFRQIFLHIFLHTVAISVIATVLILLLFIVRRLTSRWLGHEWQYNIWASLLMLLFISPVCLLMYGWGGNSSAEPVEGALSFQHTAPMVQEPDYSKEEALDGIKRLAEKLGMDIPFTWEM